jgi:hypothetical protein
MSLTNWLTAGWLVAHETTADEIRDLLAVVERELSDCAVPGLSPDTVLGLGYDAALQLSGAALAAAGYRATRARRHWVTLQSLPHTIGADSKLVARLDAFRRKRDVAAYERAGSTSEKEAHEMCELAKMLRDQVRDWIERSRPELLKPSRR